MKPAASLLFWAVVVAVMGTIIWRQIDSGDASGPWLLGAFLTAHGFVHLLFLIPESEATPTPWAFDMSRSWTISGPGLSLGTVRSVGLVLMALGVAGFVVSGLGAAGVAVPASWWQASLIGSAAVSSVMLAMFFNGQMIIGLAINVVLAWMALADLWTP